MVFGIGVLGFKQWFVEGYELMAALWTGERERGRFDETRVNSFFVVVVLVVPGRDHRC